MWGATGLSVPGRFSSPALAYRTASIKELIVAHTRSKPRLIGLPLLLATIAIAVAPWRRAHAYIDPNSAGQLYQLLFPLLIAAASALTALRRYIARLWYRVVNAVVTVVRGERSRPEADREP